MKRTLGIALQVVVVVYLLICVLLFFFQEKIIFHPEKLSEDYTFQFNGKFEEKYFKMPDGVQLHGLLFKSDSAKGLVFYLHGNAGSVATWGEVAATYTDLQHDIFIPDYRGFGKSTGVISGQDQLFRDIQVMYDQLKKDYSEQRITVIGYSIGSGIAAKLTSDNNPRQLILQAPYYSLTDMMRRSYPFIPTFILKYKLETNEYITSCSMPIVIFHGSQDEVIDYESSVKLKAHFKKGDTLITISGQGHSGITDHPVYRNAIGTILSRD